LNKKIKITSINNNLIKELKNYISKNYFFIIEGVKIIKDLINYNYSFDYFLIDSNKTYEYKNLINAAKVETVIETNKKIINKFAELVPNSDIIALREISQDKLNLDLLTNNNIIIYLHRIQDPGNVGSIIRTCFALSINQILLSSGCAKPYNSKVIRASAGTSLLMKINEINDINEIIGKLKNNDFIVYYASQKATTLYYEADYKKNFLLILGSEGTGLPNELISFCDSGLYIPMNKNLESLNVSVCAAIILFEAYKQRKNKK